MREGQAAIYSLWEMCYNKSTWLSSFSDGFRRGEPCPIPKSEVEVPLKYRANFSQMGPAFAVPASVVDDHLRLGSALQLKLLLLLLRQGSALTDEEIAVLLRQRVEDVRDAASYWEAAGLLHTDEGMAASSPAVRPDTDPSVSVSEASPRAVPLDREGRTVLLTSNGRLSRQECVDLAASDRVLRSLLSKAQEILGHPLSSVDMQCLTALYQYYGMAPEFIITVMGYCKAVGKLSMRYVERTAAGWQEQGIDTVAKAERHIDELSRRRSWEGQVRSAFGLGERTLTTREREMIAAWFGELGYGIDVIRLAYERAVENTGKVSFAYINKVLQNWHKEGVRTAADAANASARRMQATGGETSYSIQEIEDRVLGNFIEK